MNYSDVRRREALRKRVGGAASVASREDGFVELRGDLWTVFEFDIEIATVTYIHRDERATVAPIADASESFADGRLDVRGLTFGVLDNDDSGVFDERRLIELEQEFGVRNLLVRRTERYEIERPADASSALVVLRQERLHARRVYRRLLR